MDTRYGYRAHLKISISHAASSQKQIKSLTKEMILLDWYMPWAKTSPNSNQVTASPPSMRCRLQAEAMRSTLSAGSTARSTCPKTLHSKVSISISAPRDRCAYRSLSSLRSSDHPPCSNDLRRGSLPTPRPSSSMASRHQPYTTDHIRCCFSSGLLRHSARPTLQHPPPHLRCRPWHKAC